MAGVTAGCIILSLLLVPAVAKLTESPLRTQTGQSPMQANRSNASAAPLANVSSNRTTSDEAPPMQANESNASASPLANVSNNGTTSDEAPRMQANQSNASAAPLANVSNNGTTSHEALEQTIASATPLANASHHGAKKHHGSNGSLWYEVKPEVLKSGFCKTHPCIATPVVRRNGTDTQGVIGATAPMSEEGYQALANHKNDEEMLTFVVRVIEDFDCHVLDAGGLMGIIPWFSGTTAVQSLAKLEESLLFAVLADGDRWIAYKNSAGTTGANAPLDLQGYMEIAAIREDYQMETFARRLAEQMNTTIADEGGFQGMLRYHTGAAAFQSFDKLKDEISSAVEAPHSWAKSN